MEDERILLKISAPLPLMPAFRVIPFSARSLSLKISSKQLSHTYIGEHCTQTLVIQESVLYRMERIPTSKLNNTRSHQLSL
jgi:hypothetical protein